MRFKIPSLILVALMIAPLSLSAASDNPYVGFWEMTRDEDGTPKDTMEIRADGTYISHGWTCQRADVVPYHLHEGDLYASIEIQGKGPISIVFRHLADDTLTFTSPRTRNNSYYSRLAKNPCPKRES